MAFAGSIIVGSPPIIISQHSYYAQSSVTHCTSKFSSRYSSLAKSGPIPSIPPQRGNLYYNTEN